VTGELPTTVRREFDTFKDVIDYMNSLNGLNRAYTVTARVEDRPHDPYFGHHLINNGKKYYWTVEEYIP
jgi:hypothetical protein